MHSKCISGGGQLINSNVSSTVVWVANGNQPISQTAYLDFLPNGTLKLVGNDTLQPADWVRPVNASSVRGELLNTGNFVLKNGFGNATYESFNEPTDTLLPSQIFRQGLPPFFLDLSFCAESMFLQCRQTITQVPFRVQRISAWSVMILTLLSFIRAFRGAGNECQFVVSIKSHVRD